MRLQQNIFLTLLLYSYTALGQTAYLDSLWGALEVSADPVTNVDQLNLISEAYLDLDHHNVIKVAKRALEKAKAHNYDKGVWHAYNNLGMGYDYLGMADSSFIFYSMGLEKAILLDDPYLKGISKNNLGIYYMFKRNYPLALRYLQEAISLAEDGGYNMNPYATYANIGIIYEQAGNIKQAIDYYKLSAEAARQTGKSDYAAYAHLDDGYIAYLQRDFATAESHYYEALEYYQKQTSRPSEAETLYYLGKLYAKQDKFEQALDFYQKALDIYVDMKSKEDIPSMYLCIGNVYKNKGEYHVSRQLYHNAEAMAIEVDDLEGLAEIYDSLAVNYAAFEQYEEAYTYQRKSRKQRETIFSQETKEQMTQLETNFQLRMRQAETARLYAEQAKNEVILRQRTLLAWAGWLIGLLVAFVAFVFFRSRKKVLQLNQKLEQKVAARTKELNHANENLIAANRELERFTYIASHDLKEPLRNITSFVNLIQRKIKGRAEEELEEYMSFVTNSSKQMYTLVEDILAFSRVKENDLREKKQIDLNLVVDEVKVTIAHFLNEHKAKIIVEDLPWVFAHQTEMFLLIKNLIENGIKYNTSEVPSVLIEGEKNRRGVVIHISDNGIGIEPKYQDKIFEMFTRLNDREQFTGSGIGLAICKKIVQKYKGRLWVDSVVEKGSTFHFSIPNSKATDPTAEPTTSKFITADKK